MTLTELGLSNTVGLEHCLEVPPGLLVTHSQCPLMYRCGILQANWLFFWYSFSMHNNVPNILVHYNVLIII